MGVLDSCDRRRELKRRSNEGKISVEEYRRANKEVRRCLRQPREDWAEEEARRVEDCFEINDTREASKTIRKVTEQHRRQINVIEDRGGSLITGSKEVAQRWKEYCNEFYSHKAKVDKNGLNEDVILKGIEGDPGGEILRLEVEAA